MILHIFEQLAHYQMHNCTMHNCTDIPISLRLPSVRLNGAKLTTTSSQWRTTLRPSMDQTSKRLILYFRNNDLSICSNGSNCSSPLDCYCYLLENQRRVLNSHQQYEYKERFFCYVLLFMDYRGQVIGRFGKSMTCPLDLTKQPNNTWKIFMMVTHIGPDPSCAPVIQITVKGPALLRAPSL